MAKWPIVTTPRAFRIFRIGRLCLTWGPANGLGYPGVKKTRAHTPGGRPGVWGRQASSLALADWGFPPFTAARGAEHGRPRCYVPSISIYRCCEGKGTTKELPHRDPPPPRSSRDEDGLGGLFFDPFTPPLPRPSIPLPALVGYLARTKILARSTPDTCISGEAHALRARIGVDQMFVPCLTVHGLRGRYVCCSAGSSRRSRPTPPASSAAASDASAPHLVTVAARRGPTQRPGPATPRIRPVGSCVRAQGQGTRIMVVRAALAYRSAHQPFGRWIALPQINPGPGCDGGNCAGGRGGGRVGSVGAEERPGEGEPPLGGPVPGTDHVFRAVGVLSTCDVTLWDGTMTIGRWLRRSSSRKGQEWEHVLLPRNSALGLSAKSPDRGPSNLPPLGGIALHPPPPIPQNPRCGILIVLVCKAWDNGSSARTGAPASCAPNQTSRDSTHGG